MLTGNYRLKTLYDTVLLLQDLITIAANNPATIEAMRLSAAASIAETYHLQRQADEQRKTGAVVEVMQAAPQQKSKRNKIIKGVPPPVAIKNKRPVISKSSPKMAASNYSPMLPSMTAFAEAHDASKAQRPVSAEAQSSTSDATAQGTIKPSKPNKPKPSYRRIVSAV